MSHKYMITLKPLEPFFFGGESTFGSDESRQEENSRYSATSTQFPQQTALLGMLRKTMLIQNGNLTMHKKGEWVDSSGKSTSSRNYDEAKALVGTKAFSYDKSIDLGIIESISPVFINENSEYFIANAKDDGYELKEREGAISFGTGIQKAFVLDGFDAKKSSVPEFISQSKNRKNFSDFFMEVHSVGIKKSKDGQAEDNAFFRKKSYYPQDGACFSFVVICSNEINWEQENIVSLGADQSSFRITIDKKTDSFDNLFSNIYETKKLSRVVLSSSCLMSQEAYDACYFILGQRQSYRQLTDARRGKKSKRYFLLEKGSVLFSDDIEKLEKLLSQKHLQNVGINKYFTIKGNQHVQK